MNLIQLIINNKLDEAKSMIFEMLKAKADRCLDEAKQYLAIEKYQDLEEASNNIMRMGRINRIRRRIRRDSSGKIIVQRNATRSAMKGYRIVGKSLRRISAVQRLRQSQQLKRSWRSSRRSKLSRSLLKRKMSMRRRYAMGIR
jgi:hypothetical protein